jgi:uncharacterized membrane protein YhaH (DUF805 family)
MNNLIDIFKYSFTNLFTFQGRVSRSVYFIYFLTINAILNFLQLFLLQREITPYLVMGLAIILSLVLTFAITLRRVHDSGHGWKLYLLYLIPFLGPFIFIIFTFLVDESDNKFGLFNERKISKLNKNLAITLIAVLGFGNLMVTVVSTGLSAMIAQETLLNVQDNAKNSVLKSNLEMVGNQARVIAALESDGVVTVEILQSALRESNLSGNLIGNNTETGIMVTFDGSIGRIDVDPNTPSGYSISIE